MNILNIGVLLSNMSCHGEGISNSIMEYMALEKPVIATDGGGTKELVIHGENGFLIKEKNIKILVEKIEYFIDNPKQACEMGKKGKNRLEKYFSIKRMVDETFQLYTDLLK